MKRSGRVSIRAWGVFVSALVLTFAPQRQAFAQFIPYFGKNKIKYDDFAWRVYKSPHFELYYYPEFEQHLARISSYAESAYQKVSSDLKHEIPKPIPLILYKTHSEFEETNLYPSFIPEGVLAFTEPVRDRMVVPIDLPSDRLQGLITHELTHVFEFDIIPRNFIVRGIPLWVDEGLADYERSLWDTLDLMTIRDAAVADQVPRVSRFEEYPSNNPRVVYNMGHAIFEYIEARYGKEGIRVFLYTLRKGIVGGGADSLFQQAFRTKPEDFDDGFEKWIKERFKPYRDKQRPSDYGRTLDPDPERTSYVGAYGFSPSPSGEMVAAITGNRAQGEGDIVLLSTKDRGVIKDLTQPLNGDFESLSINEDNFVAGRSLAFDPHGEFVAFFGRKGKRRSLFLVSVVTGKILKRIKLDLDQAQSPAILPDGKHILLTAIKDGVEDIYLLDVDTGHCDNLTQDPFYDSDPQVSPDGTRVVYSRRVSGHDKLYTFPLSDPSQKVQLTFGTFDDETPIFSSDGNTIYYSSTEDNDTYNLRSLDLRTGVIHQYTDTLGGAMAPAAVKSGPNGDRVAFITYYKGEYHLSALDMTQPMKEVDQEVQTVEAEMVDYQPDVSHQVVEENKRRKGTFEKLFLEGRPPLNIGVTSGGDFFGGTAVAVTDVLGDQDFEFSAVSVAQFRSYDGTYINLAKRFHYGIEGFDLTQFFYTDPYGLLLASAGFSRQGAIATQRYTGANFIGQYPLDVFHRIELSGGLVHLSSSFQNADAQLQAQQAAAAQGLPFIFYSGTLVPLSISLVSETTRFAEFGPLWGSTYSIGVEYSPKLSNSFLSRTTYQADLRKYIRLGSTSVVLAGRAKGFYSSGTNPALFFFGGNMELRGYPYLSFVGNQGFFADGELRFPIIDVARTPIGLVGPIRGTFFGGIGGARYAGVPWTFSSSQPGTSLVNNAVFGEPVTGFHLVDGRASFGVGLEFFFLGYPLHFDWSKFTDLKVTSSGSQFNFWVGFDF
jgi:hypothetical protein